jgi:hypothetical protein
MCLVLQMASHKRKRGKNNVAEDSKEAVADSNAAAFSLTPEQRVPRILSLGGGLTLLAEGTESVTIPGSALVWKVQAKSKDLLVLKRTDCSDEEENFKLSKDAVQEEISKRQLDIAALRQEQQATLQRLNEADPEQAEEVAASLPALGGQISTHKRRVRALQAQQNCQYQCTEARKTVNLPNGVWVKLLYCEDPVMYVHPADTVPTLEAVEETVIVTKTRPMSNGTLYAIGGQDDSSDLSSVQERYDEGKTQWETVASMNSARSGFGVCVLSGRIYAVGGYDGSSRLSSVERYDEGKNQWETVASMNSARFSLGAAVLPSFAVSTRSPAVSMGEALSLD